MSTVVFGGTYLVVENHKKHFQIFFAAVTLPTILATWQRKVFLQYQWQQNLPQRHLMWRISGGGSIGR